MPLGPNADAGDYVDDFKTSDAPQFKGKSNKKRRQMAIAAFLDAKNKSKKENVGENKMKTFDEIREGAKADKPRGGTGIGFAPNPIKGSAKEIDTVKKMMNHPDYGGNTDKLHKALLNKFPGADKEWLRLISLPVHPAMTEEDIDYVVYWVNQYFKENK